MKLQGAVAQLVTQVTEVAKIMGIDEVAIEDSDRGPLLRGFSATHGAPTLICHTTDIKLPFRAFAINSCSLYTAKTDLALSQDENYETQLTLDEHSNNVTSVTFKGKKFKLAFNAGNPATVRAPKAVKDVVKLKFAVNPDAVTTLSKSMRAMEAEYVTVISDGDTVKFEISTGPKDIFEYEVSDQVKAIEGDDATLVMSYPFKTFFPILKHCDQGVVFVTQRGVLNCTINGINIYAFPRK